MTKVHLLGCAAAALSVLGVAHAVVGAPEVVAPVDPIARLGWLSGSWRGESRGRDYEEHWTKAAGGTLLGMSRTLRDGKTTEFEFLRIQKEGEGVVYLAQPGGKPPTPFRQVKSKERSVTFENAENDFPQRIIYTREGDALTARIEGTVNGQVHGIDFKMRKAE